MKTAIVYDRVNKWGGAERVLLALHEIFPEAPLYTSVYAKKNARWADVFPQVISSFLQIIPFAKERHEFLFFLMPFAFESHDFSNYDLVISVTSEFAKGIVTGPSTCHICYCLTPTRYLWSGEDDYFKNDLVRKITSPLVNYLKKWDKIASKRPDVMVSISTEVKKRIKDYYERDSQIIFPPVNLKSLAKNEEKNIKEKHYLLVSRLVKYKKVDLAIRAFNELNLPLVIVGSGREGKKLKKMAKKNITFAGYVSEEDLSSYYANAKGLIFPQIEDFGITAVEAQSYGVPVLAYKGGGALDTVTSNTGSFFNEQTKESLIKAVKKFEEKKFDERKLKKNAERFSKERFADEFLQLIKGMC